MTGFIDLKVAGVTFITGYPDNLLNLAPASALANRSGMPLAVDLQRNPANEFDANAVEVRVPALEGAMIGHLPAEAAERAAPVMDAGAQLQACIWTIDIDPDHLDRPGCTIRVRRIDCAAQAA